MRIHLFTLALLVATLCSGPASSRPAPRAPTAGALSIPWKHVRVIRFILGAVAGPLRGPRAAMKDVPIAPSGSTVSVTPSTDPEPKKAPCAPALVMNLAESLDVGYRQSPTLMQGRESVVQAVAQYKQLWAQKNATINYNNTIGIQRPRVASAVLNNCTFTGTVLDAVTTQFAITLQGLISTFGRVENQIAAQFVQIDVQTLGVEVSRQTLANSIKQAFFERLKADGQVLVAVDNLKVSE
ncbi:MAG: hypothetical protein FJX76_18375 [Armatimonadetes bacterium]|nr:hypothetical protein [Armatimonadota bacterium]